MRPPEGIPQTDYLVVESTYGDRLHDSVDAYDYLAEIINKTFSQGDCAVAVVCGGANQTVLYIVERLKEQGRIPNVPVYLNSPMAISATETFCKHHKEHRLTKIDCEHIDSKYHFHTHRRRIHGAERAKVSQYHRFRQWDGHGRAGFCIT